jgi:Kef-type K+ transport system membrane component KefB/Trk K+ transport system NAD-binding subunit
MANHEAFQSLLLLMLLAVAVPLIIRRLGGIVRLPIVVGEIIAGILVGRSGLNLVHETPSLSFLADFGFIFLMFLSGLELDFAGLRSPGPRRDLQSRWCQPVWLATANFGLTLLLAMGIGFVLWQAGMTRNPLLVDLILSTTSLGIVVPVLKERELIGTSYGQCLLFAALISDFVPMLLLGLLISVLTKGFSWNLLLFILLLVIFVAASKVSRWANRQALTRRIAEELSYATAQIRVRGTFALIVLWVVLAGSLGVEVILGAFMAGAIIAQSRGRARGHFEEQLDAIGYGFFIPLFFIMVGARFDLAALSGSPRALWLAPTLIAASYVVNVLPSLCLRARFSWRESIAGGVLLTSRLSLAIAAAAIAFDLGLITSGTNSAIILVAIVTCTASPVLFNRLLPPKVDAKRKGVIVLGTDFLAELLGKRLLQDGEPVTFIGRDNARLEKLRQAGFRVVAGSPDDEETLCRAGAAQACALVALSNDPEIVMRVCRDARQRFTIPSVVARAELPEHVRRLQGLNVRVVQPSMAMTLALEGALHFPAALSLLTERSDEFELADVLLSNAELVHRPLRQLHLPGQALVLGVRRQGEAEVVVPNGDTILRHGDILMLCGNPQALAAATRWIAGE